MNRERFVKLPRTPARIIVDKNRRKDGRYAVHRETGGPPDSEVSLKAIDRPLRILLPPGVGDIHWVLLRLRGLLRATGNAVHKPRIWVCSGDPRYDRSADFLKMVPWVEFQGYQDTRKREWQKFTTAAFFHGRILTTVPGFDLFLSVNKHVEQGMAFDSILPQAGPTDWNYPFKLETEPVEGLPDKFVLATFYRASFYEGWWKERSPFPVVKALGDALGDIPLVMVGAKWDEPTLQDLVYAHPKIINLVGKTTFKQLLWLKDHARGFVGHPSGSGMFAQHMGCPTILLWGKWWQFSQGMWTNWARPDMLANRRYRALSIDEPPEFVAQNLLEMIDASQR